MKSENDSFVDKLLGVFGFRRPKKSSGKNNRLADGHRNYDYDSDKQLEHNSRTDAYDNEPKRMEFQNRGESVNKSSSNENNRNMNGRTQRNKKDLSSSNRSSEKNRRKRSSAGNSGGLVLDDNFEIISTVKTSGKKRPKKTFLKVLLSVFLIVVITFCVVIGSFMIYVFKFVDGTVDQDLNNLKLAYTSIVYAQKGTNKDGSAKYVEMKRLHGDENRLWIDLNQMPETLGKAFVSAEDKRFYSHDGVDWKRTFSAMANLVFHFYDSEQGGSTITQQLVKNITNDKETSVTRKIREIMRAQYLESRYSKDVILECYLNTIHLGSGVDGVEVASCYYFDKHASELSLTQCAALAAITKNPTGYNPYKYPDSNKERRNWILDEMMNNGYITAEQCAAAKTADLGLRKTPSTVLSSTETIEKEVNSYFVDAVIEDVIQGLMDKKSYSYEYAESQLYKGGYKIYATVDLDVQKKLENVFNDDDNFMKVTTESGKKAQAAITVMDYKGHIVGVVGGRGKKTANRTLNRATQSPRQTGSSIKPVTAYAPGIEYNKITWASKMVDESVTTVNGSRWPVNYSGYYSGTVSVMYALQQSLNTIPVKLVRDMGLQTSFKFATEKLGISTLYDNKEVNGKVVSDMNLSSLALGGSTYGVTTTELTAAYCAMGNLGIYYEPHTYTQILDQYDNVIIDTSEDYHRAMSEETANVMCEMLQTVTTKGTGSAAAFGDWPIMSKTGTTTDTKDRWFVGCTPYYASSVWFGMDNSQAMGGLWSNPALKIWKAAMVKIMDGKKLKDFPESDGVVYCKYCTVSGKVARTGCSSTAYGYFKKSYMPLCDYHGGDQVDAATKPTPVGATQSSTQKYDSDDDDDNNDSNNNNKVTTKKSSTTKKAEATTEVKTEVKTEAKTEEQTEAKTEVKTESKTQ